MRPSAQKNRRETTTKRKTSSWRRKGAAMLASLGMIAPIAAPANAQLLREPQTDVVVRTMASNCFALGNESLDSVPHIRTLFNDLAALPITGAPIVARLSDPAHRFQICLDRTLPSNGILAAYAPPTNRLFVPATSVDIESVAHEAFHAYQDTLGALTAPMTGLSHRDAAVAHLLAEASAAAYSAAVIREMVLNNPALETAYANYLNSNAAYGQARAFEAAFQASYTANADQPEQERRRRALEAGGQTVVRNLMSGLSNGWRNGYAPRAANAATTNGDNSVNTNSRAYIRHRREVFTRAGAVGGNIQLVPANFYNQNSAATVEFSLVAVGLQIDNVPAPEYPRARRGTPRTS